MCYNTIWAWKWQARRKLEKQALLDERIEKLSMEPLFIQNAQTDIPINNVDKEEFEKSWLYKPVKVKGIFDHDNESLI